MHKLYVMLINRNKTFTSQFVVKYLHYPDFYVIKYNTKHDYEIIYYIICEYISHNVTVFNTSRPLQRTLI
jgi:hypothetical protein